MQWSPHAVSQWLEAGGLPMYCHAFLDHEISGKELLALEKSDFKDVGVTKVRIRSRPRSLLLRKSLLQACYFFNHFAAKQVSGFPRTLSLAINFLSLDEKLVLLLKKINKFAFCAYLRAFLVFS